MKQQRVTRRVQSAISGSSNKGYHELPDPLTDTEKTLTKFAILDCDNGGRVITSERYDKPNRQWHHKVYMVKPEENVMDVLATILVEARLK